MTPTTPALDTFVSSVGTIVRHEHDPVMIVKQIEPLLGDLLRDASAIPPQFKRPDPNRYSQYLLHRARDEAFSVVSVVWSPNQSAPIHDHGTWGVVGVLENEETETRYRRLDDGSVAEYAKLEAVGTFVLREGQTSVILPPHEIHRVENRSDRVSISIHVYGADIGSLTRHVYDPDTRHVRSFVSGYNVPEEAPGP